MATVPSTDNLGFAQMSQNDLAPKAPAHHEAAVPTPALTSLYFIYMHENENMIFKYARGSKSLWRRYVYFVYEVKI